MLLTLRTDGKVLQGHSLSYIPEGSAVFKSTSLENIEYAKEHGVWQWDQVAQQVKPGSRIFVKDTGTGFIYDIGCVTEILIEHDTTQMQVETWPNGWLPKDLLAP